MRILLSTVCFVALLTSSGIAQEASEDALVNCLVANSSVAMVLSEASTLDAYNDAWEACEREAALVSTIVGVGDDNSPLTNVDEHAYHLVMTVADKLEEHGFQVYPDSTVGRLGSLPPLNMTPSEPKPVF